MRNAQGIIGIAIIVLSFFYSQGESLFYQIAVFTAIGGLAVSMTFRTDILVGVMLSSMVGASVTSIILIIAFALEGGGMFATNWAAWITRYISYSVLFVACVLAILIKKIK